MAERIFSEEETQRILEDLRLLGGNLGACKSEMSQGLVTAIDDVQTNTLTANMELEGQKNNVLQVGLEKLQVGIDTTIENLSKLELADNNSDPANIRITIGRLEAAATELQQTLEPAPKPAKEKEYDIKPTLTSSAADRPRATVEDGYGSQTMDFTKKDAIEQEQAKQDPSMLKEKPESPEERMTRHPGYIAKTPHLMPDDPRNGG